MLEADMSNDQCFKDTQPLLLFLGPNPPGQVFIILKSGVLLAVMVDGWKSFDEGVGTCRTFLMNLLLISL